MTRLKSMESFFLWKAGKSVTKQCGLAAMAPRKGFEKCNFPRNFGVTFPKIKVTKVTLSESGCNFKNKKVTGKVTPKVTPLARMNTSFFTKCNFCNLLINERYIIGGLGKICIRLNRLLARVYNARARSYVSERGRGV